jgi:hypothetical protein
MAHRFTPVLPMIIQRDFGFLSKTGVNRAASVEQHDAADGFPG